MPNMYNLFQINFYTNLRVTTTVLANLARYDVRNRIRIDQVVNKAVSGYAV